MSTSVSKTDLHRAVNESGASPAIRRALGKIVDSAPEGFWGTSTASALTAADGSTVDGTYGAEEAAVIANNVTRIAEIEDALQAAGIIT